MSNNQLITILHLQNILNKFIMRHKLALQLQSCKSDYLQKLESKY